MTVNSGLCSTVSRLLYTYLGVILSRIRLMSTVWNGIGTLRVILIFVKLFK